MLRALATAVQDGRVSASDLIEAAVARIREHDRVINAVPFTDHAAAASAAAEIDALPLRQRRRLSLAGIPFLAKDMDDVAGWHTTFGSPAYRSNPLAPHDAPTVDRLRGAGAVPVGRSNTCEFAHEGHCSSPLYGDTRNPWQPDWSSGGSSGGSAAALAAGLVPLTTASDGGGSIRIPAALCGLVGLKPTTGSIASSPYAPWLDVHSDGVLAPVVDDVDLVMSVLSPPWRQNRPVTAVDRIVVVPRLTPAAEPSDATLRVVRSAAVDLARRFAARLEDATIECLYSDEPHLPGRWESDWYDLTSAEHAQLVGREKVEAHRADWDPTFLESLEHGLDLSAAQYVEARRRAAVTGLLTDAVLSPGTVLVAPVMSGPGYSPDGRAPGHSSPGSPAGHTHTVLANLGGQPALSLPAGVDDSGVPRGIQVVARRGDDGILMTVARAWERLHPWPLAAPGYTPFTLGELRA